MEKRFKKIVFTNMATKDTFVVPDEISLQGIVKGYLDAGVSFKVIFK